MKLMVCSLTPPIGNIISTSMTSDGFIFQGEKARGVQRDGNMCTTRSDEVNVVFGIGVEFTSITDQLAKRDEVLRNVDAMRIV